MNEPRTADEVLFDECVYLCQNHLAASIEVAAGMSQARRTRIIERSFHLKALERRQLVEAIAGLFRREE